MSQASRVVGKGQRKGKNTQARVPPPPPPPSLSSSNLGSAPSVVSGAEAPYNPILARQQAQEKKYLLWKYVTRKSGPGSKLCGGGNVAWTCNFCKNEFKSTYYRVKGHLLGLPCGLATCKSVSVTQLRDLEREDNVGMGKVAAASKRQKNEDPLPFLRKPSSTRPSKYASEVDIRPMATRKRPNLGGPMDKIF